MKYTGPTSLGSFPASPTSPIPRVPANSRGLHFFYFYILPESLNHHLEHTSKPSQSWLPPRAHLESVRHPRISTQWKSLTLNQAIPHSCMQNTKHQTKIASRPKLTKYPYDSICDIQDKFRNGIYEFPKLYESHIPNPIETKKPTNQTASQQQKKCSAQPQPSRSPCS